MYGDICMYIPTAAKYPLPKSWHVLRKHSKLLISSQLIKEGMFLICGRWGECRINLDNARNSFSKICHLWRQRIFGYQWFIHTFYDAIIIQRLLLPAATSFTNSGVFLSSLARSNAQTSTCLRMD